MFHDNIECDFHVDGKPNENEVFLNVPYVEKFIIKLNMMMMDGILILNVLIMTYLK